jgi:hypothetical protein
MDRPRHPQVIRPWKTQKTKKINGAYRPRQHGATAPGSFSALSAADRPPCFPDIEFSFWFCDESARTVENSFTNCESPPRLTRC